MRNCLEARWIVTGWILLAVASCGRSQVVDEGRAPAPQRTTERSPSGRAGPVPSTEDSAARARAAALEALSERVHFDFDRFEIKPEFARLLDRKVEILQQYPALRLTIEGHCDEWGSTEYNLVLGQRRAMAVRQYLASRGIVASRIRTTSYGRERPLSSESEEGAWARNRRAEFLVENPAVLSL